MNDRSAALADRHAIVTGASRGIGSAIAKALAAEGARVSLFGRDPATLAQLAEQLGGTSRAIPVAVDVTAAASVHDAFASRAPPFRARASVDQ